MKLSPLAPVGFQGKIIDAHMHIGKWLNSNYDIETLDTFYKQPLTNGDTIEKVLVSSLSCMQGKDVQNEFEGNMELLKIAKNNPKLATLLTCQPAIGTVSNIEAIYATNRENVYGLKFHPDAHQVMASDKSLEPYLYFAQKNNLPCLFHCAIPWDKDKLVDISKRFSSPDEVYAAARKIPKTPVIMAHLGGGGEKVHAMAINALKKSIENNDANLYADISWVDIDNPKKPTIVKLIKDLRENPKGDMSHKILFGTDAPIGEFASGKNGISGKQFYEKIVEEIKTAIKENFGDDSEEIINKVFYKNANDLFFKNKKIKKDDSLQDILQQNKGPIAFGALALLSFGAITIKLIKNHQAKIKIEQEEQRKQLELKQKELQNKASQKLVNNVEKPVAFSAFA